MGILLVAGRACPGPLEDAGALLFADTALSADGTIACATCHRPDYAFAEPRSRAIGIGARLGTRNAPSLLDVAQRPALTWDGRTATLGDQALVAFTHPREHGLADAEELRVRVSANPAYRALGTAGDGKVPAETIRAALTAFLATLATDESAFDRSRAGESAAMSASAQRGQTLFLGAAGCAQCHRVDGARAMFTDHDYHRVGVGMEAIAPNLSALTLRVQRASPPELESLIAEDAGVAALGRFVVTRNPADIGKYRTPGLRNVGVTAPYFHDGSVATLEAAVAQEIYYRGQERGRPLALNTAEQADLVAFLEALTDPRQMRGGASADAMSSVAQRMAKGE